MGWFTIIFLFFILPLILGYFFSSRRRRPLDILLAGGGRPQAWGDDWARTLGPEQANRITCPACGAVNFPSEAACWQCQRPLLLAAPPGASMQTVSSQTTSFRISQVTYNGRSCVQFTDSRGRRHVFPSWDQAPASVLEEIDRLPEPFRTQLRSRVAPSRRPAPASPDSRPVTALQPGQGPQQPVTQAGPPAQQPPPTPELAQEPSSASAKTEEKPEDQTPWIEL